MDRGFLWYSLLSEDSRPSEERPTMSNPPESAPTAHPLPTAHPVTSEQLSPVPLQKKMKPSIVHSKGCCGLGHRLVRMANAHYVAKARFNYGLTAGWGLCDKTEVFKYLFEPEDLANVTHDSRVVTIGNEVEGFLEIPFTRPGNCYCKPDEMDQNYKFYTSLLQRFRFREKVEAFRQANFAGKTAISIHIRAGNGETGDFVNKGRGIDDAASFRRRVVDQLESLVRKHSEIFALKPPVLFIATDTMSMIEQLRSALNNTMPVIDLPQHRPEEGKGVIFGEMGKVAKAGKVCLNGWEESVTDMMLLSLSDVVVASRYSSFVQSMPLSVSLGRSKFPTPYCEMSAKANLDCFESAMQWCCESPSKKTPKVQDRDYWERPESIYDIKEVSQFAT